MRGHFSPSGGTAHAENPGNPLVTSALSSKGLSAGPLALGPTEEKEGAGGVGAAAGPRMRPAGSKHAPPPPRGARVGGRGLCSQQSPVRTTEASPRDAGCCGTCRLASPGPLPRRALGGGRRGRGRWLGGGPLTVGEKDENAALLCSGTWKLWYSSGPYCGREQESAPRAPRRRGLRARSRNENKTPQTQRALWVPAALPPTAPRRWSERTANTMPPPPRVQLAPGPHPWQHTHFPRGARRAGPWFS